MGAAFHYIKEKNQMSKELKMTKEEFWHLIDEMRAACGTDMKKEEHWIVERLKTMETEQIIGFQCIFLSYHDAADKYGLWSAASVVAGGCSDDGFMDFRSWLIAQGEKNYYDVLKNPDQLSHITKDEYCFFEGMHYAGYQAYEEATKKKLYDIYDICPDEMVKRYSAEVTKDIVYHPLIEYPMDLKETAVAFPTICRKHNVREWPGYNSGRSDWNLNNPRIKELWEQGKREVKKQKNRNEGVR